MRVLVIGGTRFVGRHIAQTAIERGDDLTLFHRGRTGAGLFPEAEHVYGDRSAGDLRTLRGRSFDVTIDTSAYHSDDVALAAAVGGSERYVLISSASVYRAPIAPGSDEQAPVWELTAPVPVEAQSAEEYGGLKVLCEAYPIARDLITATGPLLVRTGRAAGLLLSACSASVVETLTTCPRPWLSMCLFARVVM